MAGKGQKLKADTVLKNYWNDNEQFADLFNLLKILLSTSKSSKEIKEEVLHYVKEHPVDQQVIMTVAGMANCEIDYNALSGIEGGNMWRVFAEERAEGRMEGKIEGKKEGKAELVVELLEEVGQVPKKLREQILKKEDPVILRKWCRIAAQVMSVEEFEKRYQEI